MNSPSSFDWLRGYEGCRTGWDRFCKPRSHTVHGSEYRDGLPGMVTNSAFKLFYSYFHYSLFFRLFLFRLFLVNCLLLLFVLL